MGTCPCCEGATLESRAAPLPPAGGRIGRWTRRGFGAFEWLVPATLLALMPKCPMCVAAYVAMATGLGISLPVAANLRLLLVTSCLLSLAYLCLRVTLRVAARMGQVAMAADEAK